MIEIGRMLARRPPQIKANSISLSQFFFLLLLSLTFLLYSAEKVLVATGVSVVPPSRRSQHLAPQAPEEPIGESRQRRETEVSEWDNDTESSAEASGDDADPKPAKSHVSRSQPPHRRDGKSSIIPDAGDDITTSHGWRSGSRTHRSYDEGIIIIII